MKIAFLTDTGIFPINSWNLYDLVETLTELGHDARTIEFGRVEWNDDWLKAFDCDVAIFYRTNRLNYRRMIQDLKAKGVKVGFSIDDLIWDERYPYAYDPSLVGNLHRMFYDADFFVLPSTWLASRIRADGHSQPVIYRMPGMLERRFRRMKKIRDENEPDLFRPYTILLSKGHVVPEQRALSEQILRLAADKVTAYQVDIHYFSLAGPLYPQSIGPFVFHGHGFFEFERYFDEIARMAPDLVMCPLPTDDFHHAKSYPKYLEAGSIRADFLGSAVHPFMAVAHPSQIGRDPIDFAEKLAALVNSPHQDTALRGQMTQEIVEKDHLLAPIASAFYDRLSKTQFLHSFK